MGLGPAWLRSDDWYYDRVAHCIVQAPVACPQRVIYPNWLPHGLLLLLLLYVAEKLESALEHENEKSHHHPCTAAAGLVQNSLPADDVGSVDSSHVIAVAGLVVVYPKILEFDHPRQDVGLQFERATAG